MPTLSMAEHGRGKDNARKVAEAVLSYVSIDENKQPKTIRRD